MMVAEVKRTEVRKVEGSITFRRYRYNWWDGQWGDGAYLSVLGGRKNNEVESERLDAKLYHF